MCVTVYQITGYAVPSKKVKIANSKHGNYKEIFKGVFTRSFKDDQTIFVICEKESICECGDENGDGREFVKDTFRPLSFDEDDMELYDERKKAIFSKLEQFGLGKHAIYGVYTDTDIECH